MMADLPPAARIIYKQDFQGMYHCVTQVVYMHFPSYDRKQQHENEHPFQDRSHDSDFSLFFRRGHANE